MTEMHDDAHGEPEFEVIGEELAPEPVEIVVPHSGDRPVIALMGEFSAGKSTLTNLLIGAEALPVNITATQLPPVWISKGEDSPFRVALDGSEYDVDFSDLSDIVVAENSHICVSHDAEILDLCDIIDMPGISDPNMDAEVWQRMIHHADAVLWCTHATQAWRQSEAAVWSTLPKELYAKSFMLLTRMDKILSDRDQMRVVRRVGKETEGMFRELFPISLTRAIAAGDDAEKWAASGAEDFYAGLIQLLAEISEEKRAAREAKEAADNPVAPVMPSRVKPKPLRARSRPQARPEPLPPL
ncbi:MAG: dynamin family protein [Pseudomonadota bacterium]